MKDVKIEDNDHKIIAYYSLMKELTMFESISKMLHESPSFQEAKKSMERGMFKK